MNQPGQINEPFQTSRRKPARGRLMTLLVAVRVAATAMVAFGAGNASAQTTDDNGDANQQQIDDSTDDSDSTCDYDGSHRGGKHWRLGMSDTLTDVLGIDAETLRNQLQDGSTLADIAAEQDVEVSAVVDALVAAISERAAEHDREIDADELTAKITALVNGERPERPDGEDGRRGRGGPHRGGIDGPARWGRHTLSDTVA